MTPRGNHGSVTRMPQLDPRILRITVPPGAPGGLPPTAPGSGSRTLPDLLHATPAEAAAVVAPTPAAAATAADAIAASPPTSMTPTARPRPIGGALDTITRARCDDVARRIIRDGGRTSIAALAREIGCAPDTLRRLMETAEYRRVYADVSDELLGTIDERIVDERADTITRGDSLRTRAMTVMAECFAIVQKHKRDVDAGANPRPGLLKVGIDAAAEVRQTLAAMTGGTGGGGTTINLNVTRNQATIIQGAIRESGVDLSDVLDGLVLDAPDAPPMRKAG